MPPTLGGKSEDRKKTTNYYGVTKSDDFYMGLLTARFSTYDGVRTTARHILFIQGHARERYSECTCTYTYHSYILARGRAVRHARMHWKRKGAKNASVTREREREKENVLSHMGPFFFHHCYVISCDGRKSLPGEAILKNYDF